MRGIDYCQLDAEALPFADGRFDCVTMAFGLRNVTDKDKALREMHRVLKPGGQLALASLGPATFHELRTAFADVDDYHHTLAFHTPAEIRQMATDAGLVAVDVQKGTEIAHYADFKTLLKAVKAIGANQLGDGRRTSLMSRNSFQRAETAYEQLRTSSGLPLSYDVIYLYAKK